MYVDKRLVDNKSQNYNPHGSVSPRDSRPGAVFRLDITRTDSQGRTGPHRVSPMAVSSHDLAAALASRLDDVAPEGFSVVADEGRITVSRGGSVVGGSAAPEILEDDAEPHIETVARSAISAIQDVFAEELKEPWPAKAGAMPDPDARVDDHLLIVWFGSETAPVLRLAPLPLAP